MSVLLVGMSHRSAPVSVLERVAVTDTDRPKFTDRLLATDHVSEAMVVSTCNRVEIYVVVDSFHGALDDVGAVLAEHARMPLPDLTKHVYVRYASAAAEHLFSVASGLDSMVVGEQQIIGQIRAAYAAADEQAAAGRTIHDLAQRALRVGKRVHTETEIDAAGASVVSVALARAGETFGPAGVDELAGRSAVVLGAGAMGGLAAAHLGRAGIGDLTVANRTRSRADRLAEISREAGVDAVSAPIAELAEITAEADILVTCTGSVGAVFTVADAHRALVGRSAASPLVICDLGLPRDVDPAVAALPGITVIDMETLQRDPASGVAGGETADARAIVAEELAGYLQDEQVAAVTPTVTALRRRAAEVVEAELMRLDGRMPELDGRTRDEVENTVRRVVEKLLHTPTVRVKQLAASPGGSGYADALQTLFGLAPGATESVSAPLPAPPDAVLTGAPGTTAGHIDIDPLGPEGRAANPRWFAEVSAAEDGHTINDGGQR